MIYDLRFTIVDFDGFERWQPSYTLLLLDIVAKRRLRDLKLRRKAALLSKHPVTYKKSSIVNLKS